MATRARDINRLPLPARVRAPQARDGGIVAKLALADRIAELPGIEVADDNPAGGSRRVTVLLQPPNTSPRKSREPRPLCRISTDGIVVFGLSDSDRYRVLLRGWGRLFQNSVMLSLPRDDQDLEIVWRILRRAYDAMIDGPESEASARSARLHGMPRFSRTNLQ